MTKLENSLFLQKVYVKERKKAVTCNLTSFTYMYQISNF